MRIAVVGAGGVGGFFGGKLAQAGEDVVFIARGVTLDALRSNGLRVESVLGDFHLDRIEVTDRPADTAPVDVVLLAVKAWQVPEAAAAVRPLLGEGTVVVPLQNGVEAPEQIATALGRQHAGGGLCYLASQVVAPGHIRHLGQPGPAPFIRFGMADGSRKDSLGRLREALAGAAVDAAILPRIDVALWEKLAQVAPAAGVGSTTRAPFGVWRTVPETRRLALQMVDEVVTIARARRIPLPHEVVSAVTGIIDGFPPDATSSLQRDLGAGRPSELEAVVGAPLRMARECGIPAPALAAVYATLLPQELRARGRVQFP